MKRQLANNIKRFARAWLLVFLFFSCKKEDTFNPNDTTLPVIIIQSPLTGDLAQGTILIKGKASDTENLRDLSLHITRRGDSAVLFEKTFDVRELPFYLITENWTPADISEDTELKLTVTASDYGNHTVSAASLPSSGGTT